MHMISKAPISNVAEWKSINPESGELSNTDFKLK